MSFNRCHKCKKTRSCIKCNKCPNFFCKECLCNTKCATCVEKWYQQLKEVCDDFNKRYVIVMLKPKL